MNSRRTRRLTAGLMLALLLVPPALVLLVPAVSTALAQRIMGAASGLQATFDFVSVDLFPPRLAGQAMTLQSAGAEFEHPALVVDSFEATANPSRWWRGAPTWWSARAEGVVLRAARDSEGRSNWPVIPEATDEAAPGPAAGAPPRLRFSTITVEDFVFHRLAPDQHHQVSISRLNVTKQSDERLLFDLAGRYREQDVTATGTLPLPGSERARDIDVQMHLPGAVLTADGSVGHDGLVPGHANFSVEAKALEVAGILLDRDFSRLAPLSLEGSLGAPQPDRWTLDIEGEAGGTSLALEADLHEAAALHRIERFRLSWGGSELNAQGVIDTGSQTITLDVASPHLDLNALRTLAGEGPPQPEERLEDPLAGLGQWKTDIEISVQTGAYQTYRVQGLEGSLRTEGQHLEFDAAMENIESAPSRSGSADAESGGWQTGPLDLQISLHPPGEAGSSERSHFNISGHDGRLVTASLRGSGTVADVDAMLAPGNLALQKVHATARVERSSAIPGLPSHPVWQDLLPVEFEVTASPRPGGWELNPLAIEAGDTTVSGNLTLDPSREPLYVEGGIEAGVVDLNRIRTTSDPAQGTPQDQEGDATQGRGDPRGNGDVFSSKPLDWGWLEAAEIDLALAIDRLHFNQTVFRNITAPVSLAAGVLRAAPLAADLSEGGVRGEARIEREDHGARVQAELTVTGLKPADLGMKDTGVIDGGKTDLLINLDSRGDSPQALAGNLEGEIAVEVRNATIRNDVFELIGSDLLLQTVTLINPFTKRDDRTELQCAAAYFAAEDGVLRSVDQLVIETSKMKVRGSGRLDLDEEKLTLDFSPSARSGLGLGLGNLSSVVRVGGTLAEPRVESNPAGLAKAGATVGAAFATGGLSLLAQGLFDRARNIGGTACGRIFEEAPQTDVPEALAEPASG